MPTPTILVRRPVLQALHALYALQSRQSHPSFPLHRALPAITPLPLRPARRSRPVRRQRAASAAALPLCLCLAACILDDDLVAAQSRPAATTALVNRAAALGWRGYVDTDVSFAELADGDYTLTARFMDQYPRGYEGPILGDQSADPSTPVFFLGQGAFSATEGTRLLVQIGADQATYPAPELVSPIWHHVALVAERLPAGHSFRLFLDGKELCRDAACDPLVPRAEPAATTRLRLGRRGGAGDVNGAEAQFYGFIDDVGVFRSALGAGEIQDLIDAERLDGTEPDLIAGFTFDYQTQLPAATALPLPAPLGRPVTWGSLTAGLTPAEPVAVSPHRDWLQDLLRLPLPYQQETSIASLHDAGPSPSVRREAPRFWQRVMPAN